MIAKLLHKLTTLLLCVIMLAAVGVLAYNVRNIYQIEQEMADNRTTQEATRLSESIAANASEMSWAYMDVWNTMHAQNEDFVGWIRFDSDLVNQPVMLRGDDFYLTHDFYGKAKDTGAVYIDPKHTLDCRNITMYGHYVYADTSAMFSPLDQLRNEENYRGNSVYRLYLENEIRVYEVAAVVEYNDESNLWPFAYSVYSEDEWEKFLSYAEEHRLYDTGVTLDRDANYTTLQTCIRYKQNDRTVIVGKEVEVITR